MRLLAFQPESARIQLSQIHHLLVLLAEFTEVIAHDLNPPVDTAFTGQVLEQPYA